MDVWQKTLYGGFSDNCCGYCRLHKCAVTTTQMKKKECLKKGCYYFIKNDSHPLWIQRKKKKEQKKRKRKMLYG